MVLMTHGPDTSPSRPTGRVCSIPIVAVTPDEAALLVVEAGLGRRPLEVHLCNAYTLSLVDGDATLRTALMRADLNLPDGTPVGWLLRSHGLRQPVRGPRLIGDVAAAGATSGLRHYFWGGGPGVAQAVAAQLGRDVPDLQVAGAETPPFGDPNDTELAALAARIRAAGGQVVWVALGTPRQDYLVPRLAPLVDCPVVPVGAAFDFVAGTVQEAPSVLHGSGFEWVYRLSREPRRLWRRYLIGNPRFALSALRHARATSCGPGAEPRG
jgi:N-acetylglucosaminyldiphosphoundecaprenol N-acetyl-beta-D-mannosaminyltransferase